VGGKINKLIALDYYPKPIASIFVKFSGVGFVKIREKSSHSAKEAVYIETIIF
jgi:hypothetical protein